MQITKNKKPIKPERKINYQELLEKEYSRLYTALVFSQDKSEVEIMYRKRAEIGKALVYIRENYIHTVFI